MVPPKDPLKYNKYVASVLLALIVGLVGGLIADVAVDVQYLDKPVYALAVLETEDGASDAPAAAPTAQPIDDLLKQVTAAEGQAIASKKCSQCHTFDAGQPNRVGPNLHGVVGRKNGTLAGFNYSSAMVKHGVDWSAETLNPYLFSPRDTVPGTIMSFAGIKDAKERAQVIKYLESLK